MEREGGGERRRNRERQGVGKKPGVGVGERDRDNLVLPSFLPFHLLASGSGCKQGNLGDVVYRVQRVPGKCSLQDLLAEQVGEKETEDLRIKG